MASKDEIDKTYRKFKSSVNMTTSEMQKWRQTKCSKKASVSRKPLDRVITLLKTPKSRWGDKEVKEAKRVISFVSRMKGTPAGDKVDGCNMSKRSISLKNWGYDPTK